MSDLGDAMANAVIGGMVLAALLGLLVGGCGVCVAQKASGYRIRVEKVQPAPSGDARKETP